MTTATAANYTQNQTKTSDQSVDPYNMAAGSSNQTYTTKSAGSSGSSTTTSSTTTSTFTISQINTAASNVKNFVETNNRLPNFVTINNQQITMPQFLLLICEGTVNLNTGSTSSITLKSVNEATNPSETVKSGSLTKTEYVKIAGNLKTFITSNGRLPNYASSSLGTIRYETLIYTYSKILSFYGTNNRLPNTVSVTPWTTSTDSGNTNTDTGTTTELSQYLQPTKNCQSTDSSIKSLASSLTAGLTSTYAKAAAIFNWVRDNVTYSFYYNSKKGATGTLSSRTANCCDQAHLVVALARAAGIPARYQHGYCKFSDGWFGHVWAQLYVDGKWYYADPISTRNTLGAIKNWSLSSYTLYGTYAELPF